MSKRLVDLRLLGRAALAVLVWTVAVASNAPLWLQGPASFALWWMLLRWIEQEAE